MVTRTVQEEIRNEDFEIIAGQRKAVLLSPKYSDKAKRFASKIFSDLMSKFKGMTQHISDRINAIFRSPEKKESIKEPIRESVREQLMKAAATADAANRKHKQKEQSIER